MKKVLVSASHFDTLCIDAWKMIEEAGYGVVFDKARSFPSYSTEELFEHPDREDIVAALIGLDDFCDEKKYEALPNLKVVAKFGVGVDNLDGALAKKHGVITVNAPGQNSNSVAELTVAFILNLLREIVPLHKAMEDSKWVRFMGTEVKGKTVGLIGFGAIARMVAEKLKAFGADIIAFDLYPNMKEAERIGVEITDMETVISKSDIVSLHIPATAETHHLFNAETFGKMKDGAYLINAARGALVDLDALADAMLSGKLAGAALDAFEIEPLPRDSKIFSCHNIVLTPHTGGETKEAYYNVSTTAVKDILRVLNGEEPIHWVNR